MDHRSQPYVCETEQCDHGKPGTSTKADDLVPCIDLDCREVVGDDIKCHDSFTKSYPATELNSIKI